ACRLPHEADRRDRLLPDLRGALRQGCRSLRAALRAPLGAAASRSVGGGRAVPRVRPAPGRFCPPSLPFVQERTPGRVLMPHAELLRQLSSQTRRAVCRKARHRHSASGLLPPLDLHGMITNAVFRLERGLELPSRPRTVRSNQFVIDNLEDLRRELQKFHVRKNNYTAL